MPYNHSCLIHVWSLSREVLQEEADDVDAGGHADPEAAEAEGHVLPAAAARSRHCQEDPAEGAAVRVPRARPSVQALLILPPQARQVPPPSPSGTVSCGIHLQCSTKHTYGKRMNM